MIVKLDTKTLSFPFGSETLYLPAQFVPYFVSIIFETFQSVRLKFNHINTIMSTKTIRKYDIIVFEIPCGGFEGSVHISVYNIQQPFTLFTYPHEW